MNGRHAAIAATATILGLLLFPPWVQDVPKGVPRPLGHGPVVSGPRAYRDCPSALELDAEVARLRSNRAADIAAEEEVDRAKREYNQNSKDGWVKLMGLRTPVERVDFAISQAAERAKRERGRCDELAKLARVDYARLMLYIATAALVFLLAWLISPRLKR